MFDKALNAAGVLEKASSALGADGLSSIRYSTTGSEFVLGQSARPGGRWPQYNFDLMITTLNYRDGSWGEELQGQRVRAEMPPRGGGEPSLPRGTSFGRDGHVWSQIGPRSIPRPWNVEDRTHQVWITPHGLVKAALRNNASLQWTEEGGKPFAAVSFTEPGRFSATAFINEHYQVERVESRVPITYCGEMAFVTAYSGYKAFGPVAFPGRIQRSQGGFPVLDVVVKDVQANVALEIEVPDSVKQPRSPMQAVKVAEGLFQIPGSHNCVAIEMQDHIIVVEAPLMNSIATAVFEAVKRAVPGKPITFVINTHHHIDHAGGLRAVLAERATIVTHALNKPLYQRYFAAPGTLGGPPEASGAVIETVNDTLVITDGARTVEVHHVSGNNHAEDLLMVYLPAEKILIEADAYSPGPPNSPPAQEEPFAPNLIENIERLQLDIERILPLHGPNVALKDLYRAVGKAN